MMLVVLRALAFEMCKCMGVWNGHGRERPRGEGVKGAVKDGNGYKIPACPRAIDPLGKDTGA